MEHECDVSLALQIASTVAAARVELSLVDPTARRRGNQSTVVGPEESTGAHAARFCVVVLLCCQR